MGTALELLIAIIAQVVTQLLPKLGTSQAVSDTITAIIKTLEAVMPDLLKAGQELVQSVQNIISALKGTDGITIAQWNQLDAFEKQIDAEFDQAAQDEGV